MYETSKGINFTNSQLVKESLERKMYEGDYKDKNRKRYVDENKEMSIHDIKAKNESIAIQYNKFVEKVKEDLLFEAIYSLYSPTLGGRISERTEALSKNLVKEFIQENGVNNLLRKYKNKSLFLSEMVQSINEFHKLILERVDKSDPVTYSVDTELKDDFFENLKTDDFKSISTILNQRIANAVDDFIIDNQQTKSQIEEIVRQTKERIDTKKEIDGMEECYNAILKEKVNNIKERKRKTILEAMIYNITESSFKNEDLKKIYFKDNKPDMDTIVDEAVIMYSFLECLNTYKLEKIDEEYLEKVIKNLKTK